MSHNPMKTVEGKPSPPPFNMKLFKGKDSFKLPRPFVKFMIHHPVAASFLNWSSTTFISAEHVVPTLATISNYYQDKEMGWVVEQEYSPIQLRYHMS